MIHNKYKILIMLLICIILLNFVIEPKKANAIGPTLGVIYGAKLGAELLAFAYACLAVGVTFKAFEEIEKTYQKWLDTPEAFNDWDLFVPPPVTPPDPNPPDPPEEPPQNGWSSGEKRALGILMGINALGSLNNLFGGIIDWFQGLGAEEGENDYIDLKQGVFTDGSYNVFYKITDSDEYNIPGTYAYVSLNKEKWYQIGQTNIKNEFNSFKIVSIYDSTYSILVNVEILISSTGSLYKNYVSMSKSDINKPYEPILNDSLFYIVKPNSPVLTDTLPLFLPQPNITVIPEERFETIILPDGTTQKKYLGNQDQFIEDLVNNTTIDNLYNNKNDYKIIETGDGLVIQQGTSTTPYPNPNPNPNPTPGEVSEVVEDIIPWFQSIINWLSNIVDEVKSIPEKITEGLTDLFVPQADYMNNKLNTLQAKINIKLNLPDLTPLPALFSGINCEPIPDGYFGGNKIFDSSYINNLAATVANWQRFLWWIVIILIGANNAYKLIRGTDLITIYGRGGKGN